MVSESRCPDAPIDSHASPNFIPLTSSDVTTQQWNPTNIISCLSSVAVTQRFFLGRYVEESFNYVEQRAWRRKTSFFPLLLWWRRVLKARSLNDASD